MRCDICGNRTPVVRRWRNAWLCQCCYRKAMEFERRRDTNETCDRGARRLRARRRDVRTGRGGRGGGAGEVEKVSVTAVDVLREYAKAIRGNWNIDGRTVKADLEYLADQMTARELTDKEARELRLCSNICPKGYGFWTDECYDCDRCDDKECPR